MHSLTREFYSSLDADPFEDARTDPATIFRANGLEPDEAQVELLDCRDRNILVLWTRQFAGKSQTAAAIALHEAITNLGKQGHGSTTLIFSSTLRESTELLRKVKFLRYGLLNQRIKTSRSGRRSWKTAAKDVRRYKELAKSGLLGTQAEELPPEIDAVVDAKTSIELGNGSRIISLPVKSQAIVGYTVDLLILDEAKVIPDDLYRSVRPMLATTQGRMIALSTPLGQRGWFWEAWKQCEDDKREGKPEPYKRFKRTCWECPRLDRDFVERERKLIGDHWFRQEYEVEFLSNAGAVFRMEDVDRLIQSDEQPYEVPWR